jgi:cytochrome b561
MATVIEQLNWSQRVNNELDSSRTWQKNWSVLYGGAQSIPEQVGNSFHLFYMHQERTAASCELTSDPRKAALRCSRTQLTAATIACHCIGALTHNVHRRSQTLKANLRPAQELL